MSTHHFIFCTGIENSYPIITSHKGDSLRRDGLQLSGHYQHWRHDFELVKSLGIQYLRYGPPYYRSHAGPGKYDWSFADETFARLQELEIEPIVDLCHFGLPDWLGGSFQNPEWPPLFAEYARAFALRFPWVRLYTPVNEIGVCAQFSARNGWWNERLQSERAYVTAIYHMCKANLLAEKAIVQVRPDAQFIQSESSTYFHAQVPQAEHHARFENARRFIALDLCYGHEVDAGIFQHLLGNGLSAQEYEWFMCEAAPLRPHFILGSDYYSTNEKVVKNAEGAIEPAGEVLGYYDIATQYYRRYSLPLLHTETNRKDDSDAPRWLNKEWFNILRLRADGVPILGFTWYSLLDQTDWDVVLREDNERINPTGLFDLERKIRPVGLAYRDMIAAWKDHLPMESLSRDLSPVHVYPQPARRWTRNGRNPPSEPQSAKASPHVRIEHPPHVRSRQIAKA
jgi:beta-glucosidase/6-phospho-beta-glucosidase/beta-galactosidase